MKILYIISTLGYGGAEKLLLDSANKLVESNEVTVIYFKNSDLVKYFSENVNIIQIPVNGRIIKAIKREIEKISPLIIHTHLTQANLYGLIATRKYNNIKTFVTIHNSKYKHNILDKGYYLLYRILLNGISRKTEVIAISKSVKRTIEDQYKIKSNRIHLLYNSVSIKQPSLTKAQLRSNFGVNNEKFVILFIGRLSKQKAVHLLIEAINLLNDKLKAELLVFIVGEGKLKSQLRNQVQKNNLEEIIKFEGVQSDVWKYYKMSDLFVLPSIFEGFGIVLIEAMGMGIPVISTNIDGPVEIIDNEKTGLLFKKRDVNDLSKKIALIYQNKGLKQRLAYNGSLVYNERFSMQNFLEKLVLIYNS
jgi:glycosyltransferase involved in cell wall biosynthesis